MADRCQWCGLDGPCGCAATIAAGWTPTKVTAENVHEVWGSEAQTWGQDTQDWAEATAPATQEARREGNEEEAYEAEGELTALRLLSLGAGVQSTALLILAARGEIEPIQGAIFSDTGWEPPAVYAHLDRLEREVAQPAGIPIHRVSSGNIRSDALDPTHRFASMPLYVKNPDGGDGMGRRQCTSEYKLKPIKRKVRELLGAPLREDGVPGRVPAGRFAWHLIGISEDERDRAIDAAGALKVGDVSYSRNVYPLLDLGLTRSHCQAVNEHAGFQGVPKSACIGCPFHTNRQWRTMRDDDPKSWDDAVDFDRQIRHGSARANAQGQPLRGQMFLHRSRQPLDEAPIDFRTLRERAGHQIDLLQELSIAAFQESLEDDSSLAGCSPFGCVSGEGVHGGDDEGMAA